MKFYRFEVINNTIHILDGPAADKILELPNDRIVKRLKDMLLHWNDLMEAKSCLEAFNEKNTDIVNKSLAQNAIVLFYKCFGKSDFRDNSLKKDTILAGFPPAAKDVFDYYKNIRDKFIAHDASRHAQALAGIILETEKTPPFVDEIHMLATTEMFKTKEEIEGLKSFYRLVTVSIKWTEDTIDKLCDKIKETYQTQPLSYFKDFATLQLRAPSEQEMFQKRY